MKKIKYVVLLFLLVLVTGCGDVTLPKVDIDCTYYIWNNGKDEGSPDALSLYDQLYSHDILDGDKIPKLHLKYTYNPDIENVTSEKEAKNILSEALKVELMNVKKDTNVDTSFTKDGISISLNYQSVKMNFSFANDNLVFSQGDYCPTLYYDALYENFSGTYTNSFTTQVMTGQNLFISSDVPSILPEEEKPVVPEEQKPKYCKFNLLVEGLNESLTGKYHVYIRKQANLDYEYAVEPVDDINQAPDFTIPHNYNLITAQTTYLNVTGSFAGTGTIKLDYDMSNIGNTILIDNDGNMMCPKDVTVASDDGFNTSAPIDMGELQYMNGDLFRVVLSELQPYLNQYANSIHFNTNQFAKIKIDGVEKGFPWINTSLVLKNVDDVDVEYLMRQKMSAVQLYCSNLYSNYDKYKSAANIEDRLDECVGFDKFYAQGVADGLFSDFSSDCPFITKDLREKIVFVLDILKIAAPIIALALSTFDFVKTIAAGDADKEMKSTFKKFLIRIGCAILLFVIPIILAFLLDLFLSNQTGYNDPFCNIIDWDDLK